MVQFTEWIAVVHILSSHIPCCCLIDLWLFTLYFKDVIAQNFLKILKGEKEAMSGIGSGKVIDRSVNLIVVSNI